jgi:phosphohistidine phosphatase
MKKLYFVRHAKSSWDEPDLSDFDRPLNDRGKRDAPRMAKRLKEKEVAPDLMLSSPAKRALSTCEKISEVLGYPKAAIKTDRRLYHASADEILQVLRELPATCDEVIVFGHNPGLTEFVNEFSNDDRYIPNVPTCGIVFYKIDVSDWRHLDWKKGHLQFFDYPKSKED